MPLAHILAPQIAKRAEEIATALGHPSPPTGYLQQKDPYMQQFDAAQQGLGMQGGKAFLNGFAEGSDKERATEKEAFKKDLKANPKSYLQAKAISQPGTGKHPDFLRMENPGPNASYNYQGTNAGDMFSMAEGARARINEGQAALDPAQFARLMQSNPADAAYAVGHIPGTVALQNEEAATAAGNAQLDKATPIGYLGQIAPEDIVAERDIGRGPVPDMQVTGNPEPRTPGMPQIDMSGDLEHKPISPEDQATLRKLHGFNQASGVGPMIGALSQGKTPGEAAISLAKLLDAEQFARFGDVGRIQRM